VTVVRSSPFPSRLDGSSLGPERAVWRATHGADPLSLLGTGSYANPAVMVGRDEA
jgi:hypothetical protein